MYGFKSKEEVERLRRKYPIGTRIRLLSMNDPYAPPSGTEGEITSIDDIGQIHWTGSGLAINVDEDTFEVIE